MLGCVQLIVTQSSQAYPFNPKGRTATMLSVDSLKLIPVKMAVAGRAVHLRPIRDKASPLELSRAVPLDDGINVGKLIVFILRAMMLSDLSRLSNR